VKIYADGTAAVNKNTFCVKKGEVFGLLGPNGAGKSSMFNIMTMDLRRTDGDIKIMQQHLDEIDLKEVGPKMGMCPQHNTIWEALTVDESLNFIG
jgi:ABC-type multidrug transport system ATPase subunit